MQDVCLKWMDMTDQGQLLGYLTKIKTIKEDSFSCTSILQTTQARLGINSQSLGPLDNVLHGACCKRDFAPQAHRSAGHGHGGRHIRIDRQHGRNRASSDLAASSIHVCTTSGGEREK